MSYYATLIISLWVLIPFLFSITCKIPLESVGTPPFSLAFFNGPWGPKSSFKSASSTHVERKQFVRFWKLACISIPQVYTVTPQGWKCAKIPKFWVACTRPKTQFQGKQHVWSCNWYTGFWGAGNQCIYVDIHSYTWVYTAGKYGSKSPSATGPDLKGKAGPKHF